jgi:hypothetical protein
MIYDLIRDGITVVPCPVTFDLRNFTTTQKEFVACANGEAPRQLALGGFGAMGTPTSFHHPLIRSVRKQCYDQMFPRFMGWHGGKNLEMMFDRFGQRLKGSTLSKESWHRDVGPHDDGDIIYGGWVNLDPAGTPNQRFSCVPGNFLNPDREYDEGFVKFDTKNSEVMSDLESKKVVVEIPPGCLIIFNQTLAHEIIGNKVLFESYRLFFNWRITDKKETIYDYIFRTFKKKKSKKGEHSEPDPMTLRDIIEKQACPSLGSGQYPPMFAQRHLINHKENILIPFSNTIIPIYRSKNDPRVIVRFFPPLIETGMMWPPYSEEDINIMLVHPLRAKNMPMQVEDINDTLDITHENRMIPSSSSSSFYPLPKKHHTSKNNFRHGDDNGWTNSDNEPILKNFRNKSSSNSSSGKRKKNKTRKVIGGPPDWPQGTLNPDWEKNVSSSSSSRRSSSDKRKKNKTRKVIRGPPDWPQGTLNPDWEKNVSSSSSSPTVEQPHKSGPVVVHDLTVEQPRKSGPVVVHDLTVKQPRKSGPVVVHDLTVEQPHKSGPGQGDIVHDLTDFS